MLKRRQFLQMGLGAMGMSLLPRIVHSEGRAKKLIVVLAYGGWDQTYLFDPKPDSSSVDTPSGDYRSYGNLDLWDMNGYSQVNAFFEEWHSRTAVINGIAVNSLVHEECVNRMLTGGVAQADICARVAAELGADKPLPYLSIGGNAKVHGFEALAGNVGYSNQLSSLVESDFSYPTVSGDWNIGLQPSSAEEEKVQTYLQARAARMEETLGTNAHNNKRISDYQESLIRADRIAKTAGNGWLSDQSLFYDYENWNRTAAALSEEFSQCVFLQDTQFWDTHSGNSTQKGMFNTLFGGLNELMEALLVAGILDDTVILVTSEMGRSPLINAEGGKDHWAYTSSLLIGADVQSGMLQGTDETLRQRGIDFATGEASSGGKTISSSDVLATISYLLGASDLYPEGEVIHALV